MTERLHFLSKLHPLKSLDIFQRNSCSHAQGDMSTKAYCNVINIRKKSEQKCPIGKWMVTCGVSITELRFGCQEFERQCWQRGKVLESEKLPILGGELKSRDQLQGFCSVMTVFFFFNFLFFYLWWILSYIEMKQPWVYMCSPSRSPLSPPSPPAPSRFSQCTRSEHLSHASNLGW